MKKNDLKKRLLSLVIDGQEILKTFYWVKCPEKAQKEGIPKPKDEDATLHEPYHIWFTSVSSLLKGFSLERHADLIDHYYADKKRKEISFENYKIQDWLLGLQVKQYGELLFEPDSAFSTRFQQQLIILKSTIDSFDDIAESIGDVLQAELFDNELSAAEELFSKGHLRAAGIISGVVLEGHLKKVCARHKIKLRKKSTIANLNDALKKEEVIELPDWRRIQLLGDIRNICGHKKKTDPTEDDIETMLSGTKKIISTVF